MKNDRILATLIVLIIIIFLWIYVRPVAVKSSCYKKAYTNIVRVNENNYEWAEGKMWLPKPGNSVTYSESYVWIYPDQSNTTRFGDEAISKIKMRQATNYEDCLMRNGLKP